jgi:hypothetical protein
VNVYVLFCSECRRRVKQHSRGRTRYTCGRRCSAARTARLKREERAANKSMTAENAVLLAEQKEFRHWDRTGEFSNARITVGELLATWLPHECPACR